MSNIYEIIGESVVWGLIWSFIIIVLMVGLVAIKEFIEV